MGEISDALEKVHGRHVATIRTVSGAYASEYSDTEEIASARKKVEVSNNDGIEEQRKIHVYVRSNRCDGKAERGRRERDSVIHVSSYSGSYSF